MNTKLSQIEKSLKLKYRLENGVVPDYHGGRTGGAGGASGPQTLAPSTGGGLPAGIGAGGGGTFGHPRNRDNEKLVEELHRYNSVLLRENGELKTKIKVKASLLETPYKSAKDAPQILRVVAVHGRLFCAMVAKRKVVSGLTDEIETLADAPGMHRPTSTVGILQTQYD